MVLPDIQEEAEVHGHAQKEIEPEARDQEWAQDQTPKLKLVESLVRVIFYELVRETREP